MSRCVLQIVTDSRHFSLSQSSAVYHWRSQYSRSSNQRPFIGSRDPNGSKLQPRLTFDNTVLKTSDDFIAVLLQLKIAGGQPLALILGL
ncbi:Uu.00g133740.m01.CDS01 [Anthostomella pinea]|uniref:Uu.00g133740.m01.CDS01 n=1 Tax=Anthostomella pinea TaxID=933095 RepID=A0AAI8VID1_9PEZI|nr:Uu.00g133740.m01.CDS01 [Anthostomella pinea]